MKYTSLIIFLLLTSFTSYAENLSNSSESVVDLIGGGGSLFSPPVSCDKEKEKTVFFNNQWSCESDDFFTLKDGLDDEVWCYWYRSTLGYTGTVIKSSCMESVPGASDWQAFLSDSRYVTEVGSKKNQSVPSKYQWSAYYNYPSDLDPLAVNRTRIAIAYDKSPYENSESWRKKIPQTHAIACKWSGGLTCDPSRIWPKPYSSTLSAACHFVPTSEWRRAGGDYKRNWACKSLR